MRHGLLLAGLLSLGLTVSGPAAGSQERQIAGVVVQMQGPADQPELRPIVQVLDASGTTVEVPLHDDAEPPDSRAGDGVWSGIAMGLTGSTFTVRMPSGPDTWMSGSFTVTDPWRPIVRFRPAPGGALVSFEPVADPSQSASGRSNPWLPSTRRTSQAPRMAWLVAGAGGLAGLGWVLAIASTRRRLRAAAPASPR